MIAFVRLAGALCLLSSVALWFWHGRNAGFWKTSVQSIVEIPIIEGMPELGTQRQIIWTEEFVCGVETPFLGFALFLCLNIFSIFIKRRLKNKTN
jgi:hypothetical protein